MEMLRVFVALPVILRAEGLVTCEECAAIGPLVALHVFPRLVSSASCLEINALLFVEGEIAHFNSQGLPLNFLHVGQVTWFSLLFPADEPAFWILGTVLGTTLGSFWNV